VPSLKYRETRFPELDQKLGLPNARVWPIDTQGQVDVAGKIGASALWRV
jgi:hypothetical protein